ncbi:hypothetical protein C3B54_1117 [Pontimonas salivibrio]|uniref:Glycosyltransferase family 2 protein n=1 Tax=Pontimonas salivibrio TaxID=1159327 RepID=A0A2L2BN10_9MICO|nr:hypothetical protein [Pontimonas salivibrio]AVG23028.1 hypothetical protein C3B54_1117 [Pontimonas salivibrio]
MNHLRPLQVHHFVLGIESDTTTELIEQHRLALRSITRARDIGVDGVEVSLELILSETGFDYSDIDAGSSIVPHNARDLFGPHARPLPSARDVFRLLAQSPAEIVILSNADICVTENFYQRVYELHRDGVHSWTAHRKTILGDPQVGVDPLDWANSQPGIDHPGSDLFATTPNIAKKAFFGDCVFGMAGIGDLVLLNLGVLDDTFQRYWSLGISFHFGDDRDWEVDERSTNQSAHDHLLKKAASGLRRSVPFWAYRRGLNRAELGKYSRNRLRRGGQDHA